MSTFDLKQTLPESVLGRLQAADETSRTILIGWSRILGAIDTANILDKRITSSFARVQIYQRGFERGHEFDSSTCQLAALQRLRSQS